MDMPTAPDTKPSKQDLDAELSELSRGVSKAFDNAQDLFQEAVLLRSHGALSRSLFLHQISMEECGKIEILGATAVSLIVGYETDLKRITGVVTKHKAKNYANAYLLPLTEEEEAATEDGDWVRALRAFKQHQANFHLYSNAAKNSSLYVDFTDHGFTAPKETITKEMVEALADLNREFLALAEPMVRMLARWLTDTDEVRKMVEWFLERAEQLKSQPEMDPRQAMSVLMTEMMSRAKSSNYLEVALETGSSSRLQTAGDGFGESKNVGKEK
ncbi:MAG: AbiV family abortive infection protein [Betaproteobacteria bacterium]|nr:AbiV family abortive infection protein [Betaproteobacteria bacterium]